MRAGKKRGWLVGEVGMEGGAPRRIGGRRAEQTRSCGAVFRFLFVGQSGVRARARAAS